MSFYSSATFCFYLCLYKMASKSNKNPRKTVLPIYRIKTIMKTTPDVCHVSNDAYFVMTRATELFIAHLTEESFRNGSDNILDYQDVADVVQFEDNYEFLRELIPKKITVRRYKELLAEKETMANKEDTAFYL